jgi:hypothetical protein
MRLTNLPWTIAAGALILIPRRADPGTRLAWTNVETGSPRGSGGFAFTNYGFMGAACSLSPRACATLGSSQNSDCPHPTGLCRGSPAPGRSERQTLLNGKVAGSDLTKNVRPASEPRSQPDTMYQKPAGHSC